MIKNFYAMNVKIKDKMPTLKFYDVKKKKSFTSDKFELSTKMNPRTKKMTYMAKTIAPSGAKANVFVSQEFYLMNK